VSLPTGRQVATGTMGYQINHFHPATAGWKGAGFIITASVLAVALFIFGTTASGVRAASLLDRAAVRLLQVKGSPSIYAVVRGHKYLFLSPTSFGSYSYAGGKIETISSEALDKLPNVRLIKSSLGSRVYLLDKASSQKFWFPTEVSFINSGEKWENIFEISNSDARMYPNTSLARAPSDQKVFYLDLEKQTRAPIPSPEIFVAKGFSWSKILTVPAAALEGYAITSPLELTTPVSPPAGGASLTISAGSDIAATIFPAGTIRNRVWTINLSAVDALVRLNSLKITKRGFMSDAEIDGVALLDEKGFLLTNPQRFADGVASFTLADPVVVVPGQPRILTVMVNFASTTAVSQKTFYLTIIDASSVLASAVVRGSFPLASATHTVMPATAIIGQLSVDSVVIASSPRNIVIGTADQILNRWRFSVAGGAEDVLLERLIFTQLGNGQVSDFGQYELVDDANKVIAKDATIRGRSILIDFGKNSYRLRRGESKEIALRADIVGGSNNTSQFIIQNDYDIFAKGATNGYALAARAGPADGNFPVGGRSNGAFNAIFIEPGKVLVDLNAQSPSGAITRGARDAVLAAFDIKALGQALLFEKIGVKILTAAPYTPLSESVTIKIKGGSAIGSVSAASVMNQVQTIYLSNPPTIQSGKVITIEIVGNVDAAASTADRYQVELSNASFVVPGTADRLTFSAAVTAAVRDVQEITLRVRHDPNFKPSSSAPAGVKNFKIGRYLFQPSAGERVRVEQVTLSAVGTTPVRFSDGYSNLKLGGKGIVAPNGNPHIFALATEINAGSESGFDLVIDTTTAVDGQTIQFTVQDVMATGTVSKTKVPVQLENSITPAIIFKKSKVSFGLNNNFTGGQTAKTASTIIGSFTMTVDSAEDVAVPELTVTETSSSSGLSVTRGYKNLRLTDASNGRAVSRTVASPVGGVGGNLLTGGPTLKPGQALTFNVVVDATGAATGDSIQSILSLVKAEGRTSRLAPTVNGLSVIGQIVVF